MLTFVSLDSIRRTTFAFHKNCYRPTNPPFPHSTVPSSLTVKHWFKSSVVVGPPQSALSVVPLATMLPQVKSKSAAALMLPTRARTSALDMCMLDRLRVDLIVVGGKKNDITRERLDVEYMQMLDPASWGNSSSRYADKYLGR